MGGIRARSGISGINMGTIIKDEGRSCGVGLVGEQQYYAGCSGA